MRFYIIVCYFLLGTFAGASYAVPIAGSEVQSVPADHCDLDGPVARRGLFSSCFGAPKGLVIEWEFLPEGQKQDSTRNAVAEKIVKTLLKPYGRPERVEGSPTLSGNPNAFSIAIKSAVVIDGGSYRHTCPCDEVSIKVNEGRIQLLVYESLRQKKLARVRQ
ncbi:hypothetical protein FB446DRAFT_792056 [Lentinula raphanica]|nr:hypothetical protein FB446DRAFT_792056 [Lentinula raphanica]